VSPPIQRLPEGSCTRLCVEWRHSVVTPVHRTVVIDDLTEWMGGVAGFTSATQIAPLSLPKYL